MNNKGFTLIELVATIALLAVISLISFVSINTVIDKSKVSNCENLIKSIKNASKEYVSDNRYTNIISGSEVKIDAKKLVDGKYLNGPITNPFNNDEIDPEDISITIYLANDYSVDPKKDIVIKNKSDSLIECTKDSW